LLFIFILQLGPATPGFSRFVGFAVVIHNFAEVYLIRRLWFGKSSTSYIGIALIVVYVFLMTTFLAFLPMNTLYFIALAQGATMDYLLCIGFPLLACKFMPISHYNQCDWALASIGAFIHIASIQPLFFGFSIGNGHITGITALFLFPTFVFYTFFAAREVGRLGLFGPSFQQHLVYWWGILMLNKVAKVEVAETLQPLQSVPTPHSQNIKQREVETAVDINTTISAKSSNADNANNANTIPLVSLDTEDDLATSKADLERARMLAQKGIVRYFNLPVWQVVIVYVSAAIIAVANAIIVWYSPCYIHTRCKN